MAGVDHFDYGDQVPPGLAHKWLARLVVVVFIGCTFGLGAIDQVFPVREVQALGIEAAELQQLRATAALGDGTMARLLERQLRDRSRTRKLLLSYYSYFMYAYLDEAPKGNLVGREHWVFKQANVQPAPFEPARASAAAVLALVALDRRLDGNGIELNVLPVPRKAQIAHSLLPAGVDGQLDLDDGVIDGLINRGVRTVDLRAAYGALDPGDVYLKLDTHWTPHAARTAAQATAQFMGLMQPVERRLGSLRLAEPMANTTSEQALLYSFGVQPGSFDLERLDLKATRASVFDFESDPTGAGPLVTPPPIALAGTSFSVNQSLGKALAHYSGQAVFDLSAPAQTFMWTLAELLKSYASEGHADKLKRVIFETPIGSIFSPYTPERAHFPASYGEVFQVANASELTKLAALPPGWVPFGLNRFRNVGNQPGQPLIRIPAGRLTQSGDGVLCLSVSGRIEGAPATLLVVSDSTSYAIDLATGDFASALPILTNPFSSKPIQVFCGLGTGARMRLEQVELAHQPASGQTIDLAVVRHPDHIEMRPPEAILLGSRAALLWTTRSEERAAMAATLRVFFQGQDEPEVIEIAALAPGVPVAVDLGAGSPRTLVRIELVSAVKGLAIGSVRITGS